MRLLTNAIALVVLAAACTPSAFDDISRGKTSQPIGALHEADPTKPDPTLSGLDPRPIAPFSTSWVNTDHPHFKWALKPGTAGATVQISKTRDFASPTSYVATGSDFVTTDALEPGLYFWRLQARSAAGNPGVTWSPIWEVLVRGPGKNGASEAAHGGIMDVNGDGIPDFAFTMATLEQNDPPQTGTYEDPWLLTLFGIAQTGNAMTAFDPFSIDTNLGDEIGSLNAAIAAGYDLDGDGYGDEALGDVYPAMPPDQPDAVGELSVYYGGVGGTGNDDLDYDYGVPNYTTVPVLAAGDFDGDGYGDLSGVFPDVAMTMQGSSLGPSTVLPFEAANGQTTPTPVIGAGDFDGDGVSDVAYTPFSPVYPVRVQLGAADKLNPDANLTVGTGISALPTRATAITTGDFDGDGVDEVAFTTTVGGKNAICVHSPSNAAVTANSCYVAADAAPGFGVTLGAGDFDGDGNDDILVASTSGYTLLTHTGKGFTDDGTGFTATPVAGSFSTSFSVLHPGRPGAALWATFASDGTTLVVLQGVDQKTRSMETYDFTKLKDSDVKLNFEKFGPSIR